MNLPNRFEVARAVARCAALNEVNLLVNYKDSVVRFAEEYVTTFDGTAVDVDWTDFNFQAYPEVVTQLLNNSTYRIVFDDIRILQCSDKSSKLPDGLTYHYNVSYDSYAISFGDKYPECVIIGKDWLEPLILSLQDYYLCSYQVDSDTICNLTISDPYVDCDIDYGNVKLILPKINGKLDKEPYELEHILRERWFPGVRTNGLHLVCRDNKAYRILTHALSVSVDTETSNKIIDIICKAYANL